MEAFSNIWSNIQQKTLFYLEESLGKLSAKEKELVYCFEELELEKFSNYLPINYIGRKRSNRLNLLKVFIAKFNYSIETNTNILERLEKDISLRKLCGYDTISDLPSESTLSRAFAEISEYNIYGQLHDSLIKNSFKDHLVGHISRDSTAITAREKAIGKYKKDEQKENKNKRGRPRKGDVREKPEKVVDIQARSSLDDNLINLPTECNFGTKKSSAGKKITWKGYKLHIDVVDGDIPISACLTSASMHDSQASIPLAQMSKDKVINCYTLMDSAYDSNVLIDFSKKLDQVPIIDPNPRNNNTRTLDPAEKERYKQRSSVERVNSYLKDSYGANRIRVRGYAKIFSSLMIGILLVSVKQIARLCVMDT